jgi:hypothetical protein
VVCVCGVLREEGRRGSEIFATLTVASAKKKKK